MKTEGKPVQTLTQERAKPLLTISEDGTIQLHQKLSITALERIVEGMAGYVATMKNRAIVEPGRNGMMPEDPA